MDNNHRHLCLSCVSTHSTYIILEFELDYNAVSSVFTRYLFNSTFYILKARNRVLPDAFIKTVLALNFFTEDTLGLKSLSLCRLFQFSNPLPLSQVCQVLLQEMALRQWPRLSSTVLSYFNLHLTEGDYFNLHLTEGDWGGCWEESSQRRLHNLLLVA